VRYVLAGVVVPAVLVGAVVTTGGDRGGAGAPARASPTGWTALAESAASLPPPAAPAFRVGNPRPIDVNEARARYAPVTRRVSAVTEPGGRGRAVATLEPTTEEGTTNVVLVVEETTRAAGAWVRVRLPVLPNGRTGWVPRRTLGGYGFVRTRLVVDRARLTATLLRDGRALFRAPIGIGVPAAPTPPGEFYIRVKLAGFDDAFYGPVAFGTNGRSAVLTDWPGGGYIGIHGTNAPELIPGRISHGCIRLRNEDILRLSRLMPVGTPVTIR
jgi:lipoprotein-anchoring transpeptidase ErfK/SrfK